MGISVATAEDEITAPRGTADKTDALSSSRAVDDAEKVENGSYRK